jgi:hypothetical protein
VEFQPAWRVFPEKRYTRQVRKDAVVRASIDRDIKAIGDNWATLHLGTILPRPSSTEASLHARSFPDTLRHFILPVVVAAEGQPRLSYWFVCNEGATAEDTVILNFPKTT